VSDRLPVVTAAVAASVRAELLAAPGNEYAAGILERLARDNPELANFIAVFAQTQQNPTGVATAAVLTCRLLESQLEADSMDRSFGV
jgi:hypothetical protein